MKNCEIHIRDPFVLVEDGKYYNTSFCFDKNGEMIGRHRKVHLFDINVRKAISFKESDTFTAGEDLTVLDTEFGKIGVAICYDIRFPEIYRAYRKAGADLLVMAYHRTFKLPVTISRCSNNYGAYQFPEKLIPVVISKALKDESIPVYGKGENVRDWIHVHDHNVGVDMIVRNGRVGEVYNLGGRSERTNLEVVKTILAQLGKPESLITYVTDRPGHDLRYAIDSTKAEKELGFKATKSLDDMCRDGWNYQKNKM